MRKVEPAVAQVQAMMARPPIICTPNCSPRLHASFTFGYAAYWTFPSVQKMPVAMRPQTALFVVPGVVPIGDDGFGVYEPRMLVDS